MRIRLESMGIAPDPSWILATDGPGHISGEMREKSDDMWRFDHENSAAILLGEAAERLDEAHEEWMMDKLGIPSE